MKPPDSLPPKGRRLAGADLSGEDLRESHLAGADLTGARLRRSNLHGVDLRGARLREAVLDEADLEDALLSGADLSSASLDGVRANGAILQAADFTLASLRRADLRSADLTQALLTDADLTDADLERAVLQDADLIGAELVRTSFREAIVAGANLREAHLDAADFSGARFAFTVLAASDLSRVRGLDAARHDGPSTVGIDAFLLSRGEIPDAFLAGIGLSTLAIEYLKSVAAAEQGLLVGDSIFLVFHDADRSRARRLRAHLRMHQVSAWYWQEADELAGRLNLDLRHRIRFHDRIVLLHSAASERDPRIFEPAERALALEPIEGRPVVLVAGLDDAPTTALPEPLAERIVADFSSIDWDDPRDPAFRRELDRLLGALR